MKPEQVKELVGRMRSLAEYCDLNKDTVGISPLAVLSWAAELEAMPVEQAEREAVGQPGEENWWSGAALDVMRHAKASNPPDWDNAIRSGLLSAYNRGQDAPRPEASTRELRAIDLLNTKDFNGSIAQAKSIVAELNAALAAQPEQEVESRSTLKRKAVMKGEPMPTFKPEQEKQG